MRVSSVVVSGLILFNLIASNAHAEENQPLAIQEVKTDQVIVTFKKDGASEETRLDVSSVDTAETEKIATLKVPEGEALDSFIEELEARPEIESVEPDHLVQLSYTPNDPYFNSHQYHHKKIEVEKAWDLTKGSSDILVAVLDSGFDMKHIDLKGQLVSPSYTTSTGISIDEHGTHVAGIIGSSMDNGILGAGVAPQTSIMPIDVFEGTSAYISDIIEGIYHAVSSGADIINMSLGSYYYSYSFDRAVQHAYQNGVVVVAAAGNDATTDRHYPSSYEHVVSVGSTDSADQLSYFSNYGSDIDIVAPGSSIYSTMPSDKSGTMSGTSMAAPVVAGVAALILANEPHLTNDEVVKRLFSTAKDIGSYGKDSTYGNGLVNAKNALKILDYTGLRVDPIGEQTTSVRGYIPFYIESGTVVVRNQTGTVIGTSGNYSSYSKFEVNIPKQTAGTKLYVSVIDQLTNESKPLKVVVADSTAPKKPVVYAVSDQTISVNGTAEAGSIVTIKVKEVLIGKATAAANGKYSVKIAKQKAGTSISVYATDAAGNKSVANTLKVLDKTAPLIPSVNTLGDNSIALSGKAETGAKVYAYVGSKKLGEATSKNGVYSINIVKQKAGTIVTVYAVDLAKNKSAIKTVKVVDKTAPAVPVVNKMTSKMSTISGKGEKASTVLIYNGSYKVGQGTMDSKGNFKVKIKIQKKGTFLKVRLQDKAGNKSISKTVKVS